MFFFSHETLEDKYLNIQMSIRLLKKQSDKSAKEQRLYLKKARQSIEDNELERAEIYAQQSIKHKHLSLRYLQLSLRMDIVSAMCNSALITGQITQGVSDIIGSVNAIAKPENIIHSIDVFERTFDNLSITVDCVGNTLNNTAGLDNSEATELFSKLKEESALTYSVGLPTNGSKDTVKNLKTKEFG
jgi:hypothetical protein